MKKLITNYSTSRYFLISFAAPVYALVLLAWLSWVGLEFSNFPSRSLRYLLLSDFYVAFILSFWSIVGIVIFLIPGSVITVIYSFFEKPLNNQKKFLIENFAYALKVLVIHVFIAAVIHLATTSLSQHCKPKTTYSSSEFCKDFNSASLEWTN